MNISLISHSYTVEHPIPLNIKHTLRVLETIFFLVGNFHIIWIIEWWCFSYDRGMGWVMIMVINTWLVGGLVAIFGIFPLILGISNHPSIDELIFFRGVAQNHQPDNVKPGLINHSLLTRRLPPNSNHMIRKNGTPTKINSLG